jgi:hypothetical protein
MKIYGELGILAMYLLVWLVACPPVVTMKPPALLNLKDMLVFTTLLIK